MLRLSVLAVLLCAILPALGADEPTGAPRAEFLPSGEQIFPAPLADLTKPRFEVSWQRWHLDDRTVNVGRANLGSELPVARWSAEGGHLLEIGLDAGVLAVFNLDGRTQDLLNADYAVGLPVSWRRGPWSARLRVFHASSHLGDEFLLFEDQPLELRQRIELSYEALDALAAFRRGRWRVYAGTTRILSAATPLERHRLQAGAEAALPAGGALLILALDAQAWDETDWDVQAALRVGARFARGARPERSIDLFLEAFDGPLPFGQFYVFDASWVGLGLRFRL